MPTARCAMIAAVARNKGFQCIISARGTSVCAPTKTKSLLVVAAHMRFRSGIIPDVTHWPTLFRINARRPLNCVRCAGIAQRHLFRIQLHSSSMSMDPPRVPAKAVPTALPAMVDIGANLLDTMFQGEYHGKKAHEADLDQVLIRSRRAGVVQQIVTAGSLQETQQALNLVAQHGVYRFMHPRRFQHPSMLCF